MARADRVTIAVTLYAVLELYKQGELSWTQDEPFARDHDRAPGGRARNGALTPAGPRSRGPERLSA